MYSNRDFAIKHIIYKYSHSFEPTSPYLGLFKMLDGRCIIHAQQYSGFTLIDEELQFTQIITWEGIERAYTKTIEIDEELFDNMYFDIVNTLPYMMQKDDVLGFDGDDLRVEIEDFYGHKCNIGYWCPDDASEENHPFNKVYRGFIEVLKIVGFYKWYDKLRG